MKKVLIILVVAALAGGVWWKTRGGGDFLYAGTVEATEVDLSARISGVISSYKVREGDAVKKNALLVSLDCDDVRLAADIARKDFKRAEELYHAGSLSKENYDRLKYRSDDSSLRQDWCRVKSPVNGTVLYKYHEDGELVAPGTKLVTVADLSEVYAYVYVPHDMVVKLALDMPVTGVLPEAPGKTFAGKITVINQEAEFTPKNVQTRSARTSLVFGVKVVFPNAENVLKPGMTVEVNLPK